MMTVNEKRKVWRDKKNFNGLRSVKLKINPVCEICFSSEKIVIHHKDQNKLNNSLENFVTLCRFCHWGLHQYWNLKKKFSKFEFFIS
jgi:hypothetical protein